jgi:hypothetical protein
MSSVTETAVCDDRDIDDMEILAVFPLSDDARTNSHPEEYRHWVDIIVPKKGFNADEPVLEFFGSHECRLHLDIDATPEYSIFQLRFLHEADATACREKFKDRLLAEPV